MNIRRAVFLSALFACTATSLAQTDKKEPDPKPATQPAADPLGGPKVEPRTGEPSLVATGMEGTIKRLEVSPEEAALPLLGLDDKEIEATVKVLDERAALLDKIVSENIPLLLKFQALRQGDTQKEQMQALTELAKALKPLREAHRLRDELARAMTPEKAEKMNRLVAEYWTAIYTEAEQTLKVKGGRVPTRAEISGYQTLLAVGLDIKRSYERVVGSRQAELDGFLKKLSVTPEQDTKIRNLATDYAQKTLGKPTPDQRTEFFAKVLKELDNEQKAQLLREFYNEKK